MLRRRNGYGGGCRKRSGGNNGCGAEWVRIGDRLRRVFQKNQFRSDPSLRNWLQTIRLNQNARSKSVCPLEIIDIHYIRRASRKIIPVFIAGAGNYQRIAALCGFSLLYRVLPLLDRKLTSTVTNPSKAFIDMSTKQVSAVIKPLADEGVTVLGSVPVTVMLLHPVTIPFVVFSSVAVTVETVYPPILRLYIVSVAVVPLSTTVT